MEAHADYLEEHIEEWLVTNTGSLLEGVSSYYMRILPEQVGQEHPAEDKESRVLHIANPAPDQQSDFPARDVVDGGFLELVRYGIQEADDPLIVNTLKVIDATIKTDTPMGPTWHRYNHDGYGQQGDGSPFTKHDHGRIWPLLTGERGHYELAAGRDATPYLRTMEALASKTGLIRSSPGMRPICPRRTCSAANRPGRRCRWCGARGVHQAAALRQRLRAVITG